MSSADRRASRTRFWRGTGLLDLGGLAIVGELTQARPRRAVAGPGALVLLVAGGLALGTVRALRVR